MIATLRYSLPDEQAEFDAARLGSEAMQVLWQTAPRPPLHNMNARTFDISSQ